MGCYLLLLLLLGLSGQGSAESHPEVLQAPVGSSILVQCHYRLQDVRAPKVWCRFSQEECQPLVTSAVVRGAPGSGRIFLTDLGGGLLQVEMVTLQEEDTGEYGCVVEGAAGPQTLHRVSLLVLPPVPGPGEEEAEEKESYRAGSLPKDPSLDPAGSAGPHEFRRHEKSIHLIWGAAVLLLGLLVVAVVLLAVLARKKGMKLPSSSSGSITYVKGDLFECSRTDSLAHCISEDCRMGAGIAVLFKKKFGGVQELLNQHYKETGLTQANLREPAEEFRGYEVPLPEEWSH
ncbi:Trem-like transcript 1 protein [Microtus ochrogaster]|uniref:Trem-like transcript 1 protein n=1 Tax=Microtus ochrogaster TaxID=79684 RepID=A0A8J6L8E9_MICOH|nr:Trem-like transcript 1 protein [Microtus ochrogaster]